MPAYYSASIPLRRIANIPVRSRSGGFLISVYGIIVGLSFAIAVLSQLEFGISHSVGPFFRIALISKSRVRDVHVVAGMRGREMWGADGVLPGRTISRHRTPQTPLPPVGALDIFTGADLTSSLGVVTVHGLVLGKFGALAELRSCAGIGASGPVMGFGDACPASIRMVSFSRNIASSRS